MRNISFQLTTDQFLRRTKFVTRRLGWKNLTAGDLLQGCKKCMGLKPGEKIEKLGVIRVVSVRRESLRTLLKNATYGVCECELEGFPMCSPNWFVDFFCKSHKGCTPDTEVTRIEFEYIDDKRNA